VAQGVGLDFKPQYHKKKKNILGPETFQLWKFSGFGIFA
jgi:hypothetical protein